MIELKNVCAGYGGTEILHQITLAVNPGEAVTIAGANGSGKSTLLATAANIIKPTSGQVTLDNIPLHDIRPRRLAEHLAYLPQSPSYDPEQTVAGLAALGRFAHGSDDNSPHGRAVIGRALELNRVTHLAGRKLGTLSGGERQRAFLAYAFAQEPEYLLLDEPASFLDIRCQMELCSALRRQNRELGVALIMVLHDLNRAARLSDRIALLKNGSLAFCGEPREALKPEILHEVFGCRFECGDFNGTPWCLPIDDAD
ncbi:MAG: ABC transporter ATP-binding protein [Victivallaceae bacterium]|nr:ABC transporter ATP-binding protein [Victivallaceae bacterium]